MAGPLGAALLKAAITTSSDLSTASQCPANFTSHGQTPDGAWLVCEVTLATNEYGQMTPSGRLEFHATNGNGTVHSFGKTSDAMFGCNGKNFNATAGCGEWGQNAGRGGGGSWVSSADPVAAQLMDQTPAMILDGGPDLNDPAVGGRAAKVIANSGWNAHTFVGSRSAATDAVFDSYGGDVNSVGYPSMNPFLGKYHRSRATFKDKMNRLEQREGLWGGYLPVVSFHFKISGAAPTPGKCSDTPQPCPSHPGRTFCPNVHKDHQCDSAPAPCPPCPHPPPPPTPQPSPGEPCAPPKCAGCKPVGPVRTHFQPCQHHPQRCCGFDNGEDSFIALPARTTNISALQTDDAKSVIDPYGDAELSKDASGGWVEWTAVPVPDMQGNYVQDVFFRVIKFSAAGEVVEARYFDTYAYRSMDGVAGDAPVPGMGHPPGSAVASRFYQTLLDQKYFWESTFAHEGTIKWKLPATMESASRAPSSQPLPVATTTTGASLANRVWHSIVRDMIIRAKTWQAKYGVLPNVYGGPGNFNCDLTMTQSLLLGLHTGSFDWARGVLENFFRFDQRPDGPRYRGPSMVSNGQHLSEFALYYSYTGDPTGILTRYHDAVLALVNQLRASRAKALRLPRSNLAYGMPTGNTIDDLTGTSVECGTTFPDGHGGPGGDCETRLPSFDIAFKMIAGFRELGDAWIAMDAAPPKAGQKLPTNLTAEGQALIAEADALRNDTLTAFYRGTVTTENITVNGRNVTCHPCHAGWVSCNPRGDVTGRHYNRPSADVMCGAMQVSNEAYAALPAATFQDVFDYQEKGGNWDDVQYNLMVDNPQAALATFFVTASRIMTRGTWTGAEIGGSWSQPGTGVSTVTSSNWATGLTHLFVFDQAERNTYPFVRTLWLGKAIPRAWLVPGDTISIHGAPTRYGGRLSMSITATIADQYKINVTLPNPFTWPEGGIKLRIRSPGYTAGRRISGATVGGKPYLSFNSTQETIVFSPNSVAPSTLQDIVVVLS